MGNFTSCCFSVLRLKLFAEISQIQVTENSTSEILFPVQTFSSCYKFWQGKTRRKELPSCKNFLRNEQPKTEQNLLTEVLQGEFCHVSFSQVLYSLEHRFLRKHYLLNQGSPPGVCRFLWGERSAWSPQALVRQNMWRSPICRDLAAGFLGETGTSLWKNQEARWFGRTDCLPCFDSPNHCLHHHRMPAR